MTALFIGIYGASGFGKEVMPLVRQQYPALAKNGLYLLMMVNLDLF